MSGNPRAPGVYVSQAASPAAGLDVTDTSVPCFVGLAEKGPLNEPVVVSTWEAYVKLFGSDTQFYMTPSIEGFFKNGGRKCFVVRVAHTNDDAGNEVAAPSQMTCLNALGKPALTIQASSAGKWGNEVWASAKQETGASALLTRDVDIGGDFAKLASVRGFSVGDLVRIHGGGASEFVVVTKVTDEGIGWSSETPIGNKHLASAPSYATVIELEIQVALRDRKEVHRKLQMHPSSSRYAPRILESKSRLVAIAQVADAASGEYSIPVDMPLSKLNGGRDGTDVLTVEDFVGADLGPGRRTGLQIIRERDEIGLIVCPDAMVLCQRNPGPLGHAHAQRVQDAMVDICENTKYQFAILDIPRTKDIEEVKRWRSRVDSSYCAYYWPWLKGETSSGVRVLPPSGMMAGMFATTEREGGVHIAPANRKLSGILDIDLQVTEAHCAELSQRSVNTFKASKSLGIRPWGVRTASSDPQWRHVTVRRTFIMLRRSLDYGLGWVPFEPNNANTRKRLVILVNSFLNQLFAKGMFAGGNQEEAFFVKCDDENNLPSAIGAGKLLCQIGVAPAVPTEFILIDVEQEMLVNT